MEAQFGENSRHLFGQVLPEFKALGKKSLEWDLNDWKWDGDIFSATPVNPLGSNSSSSSDDVILLGDVRRTRELEKRRRDVIVIEEEEEVNHESGSLNLNLGVQAYPIIHPVTETLEGKSGKKSKIFPGIPNPNRAVCQVEDCRADLSKAKDYHRRHKVCEIHSKAGSALVGNVLQRFCQQCSRFHVLQEFDEGKRSCRRRLAGHNKRRRKTHPENVVNNAGTLNDEQCSSYLLISLLRILSNMHPNNSEGMKDQDLLSHFLRNLSSLSSTINGRDIAGLLSSSQSLQQVGTSGNQHKELLPGGNCGTRDVSTSRGIEKLDEPLTLPTPYHTNDGIPPKLRISDASGGQTGLNNFDLNSAYDDSDCCEENMETSLAPVSTATGFLGPWQHHESLKSSPPQTSRNSDSTLSQSPSSSSGEAQSRTDRIVFKLFGKDPSNLPPVLRKQILDWLPNSPTDIESYIRPGCIILTIYLRLSKSTWEELSSDLGSSLLKLLNVSNNSFWNSGWVYTMVQHHVAFMYNGNVVLDTPLPCRSHSRILSVKPIAVTLSERAQFFIKGLNLSHSTLRILCALEGKYLVEENCSDVLEEDDGFNSGNEVQIISFSCSMPNMVGRGFIEVEDHGLSNSFFPFIVAEQDICSEICMLEKEMELIGTSDDIQQDRAETKNQAVDFIHEIGWLLHRSNLRHRMGTNFDQNQDLFPFKRFRWIMEFSIDHGWCAVVNKLLEIIFNGCVDSGDHSSIELAVSAMTILHRAVIQNCRAMVELLLRYKQEVDGIRKFLFRPDTIGPGGLTPLHVAASRSGSESVLDALTDDPGSVGIEAWKGVRDNTGLTPNEYASLRGYYSYIHLIQKKSNKTMKTASGYHHVALDIPYIPAKIVASFDIEKKSRKEEKQMTGQKLNCGRCEQKLMTYGRKGSSLSLYRPAMLSMVAVAAVCVCVALFFKSCPEVLYVFKPFRWEQLKYGSI
ncbi:squamosa promoter-binding-like protein 1 [Impatiens glandulifera]|uniref:squamosa promoter-binding-like protein 1 n=1 Tax=Impatiens glandulifera TaxID=253017 RepID=UPI001FB0F42C|nr:squamosa promoter-binding-like protein 1 [Impatiens glandulifera]XP_047340489.1 squamosa promoter-binding-like protein 1 [Impatiens glandulifera]